ncbi:DMT family transporter [Paraburkholderia kirstenboschensis]|uniref:DMT family transporter n=1 Tax=Paraburkholderia kirstenboschensis TaxID=1245436 RepID=A0ABZ0EIM6_9BURK|nr:DMT family transporter [Paraburkholderia kirstenboschensis]WOD17083.1 DMT family transporter [Paraburkholderia kirstenboschensis]
MGGPFFVLPPSMRLTRITFVLLGLFWGSNFIYMKWATEFISPMQVAFLRVLFGFVPLAIAAWHKRAIARSQLRLLPHFLVMAVGATAFYFTAIIKGTAVLPSGIAGVLGGAIALFAAIFSFLFLRTEKLNALMAAGVVLGFAGIVLIARPWESGNSHIDLTGMCWVLASSIVLGLSYIYVRIFLSPSNLPPLALATWQMGLALLVLGALTDFTGIGHILQNWRATAGVVIGLGILGTGVAFLIYYYLLQELGAVASSGSNYMAPAVALLIGWAVGERFGLLEFAAIVLTFAGITLLQIGQQRASGTLASTPGIVCSSLADAEE